LAAVGVTGTNPYFWEIKDQVLTDLPFLLFVYPALFLINRAYESSPSKTPHPAYAGLTGILISLAYGMRVIGIILLPCLLIHDYIRTKRISRFAVTASLVSVSLIILQSVFVRASESYLAIISLKPSVIYGNIGLSIRGLYLVWENGASDLLAIALFVVLCALAALGYRARVKNRVTSFEIFAVLYLASIIVSPLVIVRRYVIPLIPLFIFYVFTGIAKSALLRRKRIERVAASAIIIAILISYAGKYAREDFGPIQPGIGTETASELFSFIKSDTESSDAFIFWKPRALALFTGRRASGYHPAERDEEIWSFIQTIDARYVVIGREDPEPIHLFEIKHRDALRLVFSNQDFQVYKINAPAKL
jgi:hypothetical protein